MKDVLVIVPCGQAKIWDRQPARGPVPACDAYTGAPFKVNRRYAEHFAERWVILSAKYGFIPPDYEIPGPYNVTFKKKSTNPINVQVLQEQILAQGLHRFETIIGLGGIDYRARITDAFSQWPLEIHYPFAGLRLGVSMRTINKAIERYSPNPTL
ncbi:MAG: DUF6884 domain-containing protein [Syntrophobacteria bacterium]